MSAPHHAIVLTRPSQLRQLPSLLETMFGPLLRLGGGLAGVGAAPQGAIEVIKLFAGGETSEEKAWRLIYAALEGAIDEITTTAGPHVECRSPLHVRHLMNKGGGDIDFDHIEVPTNFLAQPASLPLLAQIQPLIEAALVRLGLDGPSSAAAARRLPEKFVGSLYRCGVSEAALHAQAIESLQTLLGSQLAVTQRQQLSWAKHRLQVKSKLNAPLLNDRWSLDELRRPPRAYWRDRAEDGRAVHHVEDLTVAFDLWVDRADPMDALRVVTGGPGSGKSSFVAWWACQQSERIPALVVPLHELHSFDLVAAVDIWRKPLGFARNPLDHDEGEARLLLILDGLDELVIDDKAGLAAARALWTSVTQLLHRNHASCRLQIVLTGRQLIVEGLGAQLRKQEVYHLLGYLPGPPQPAAERQVEWLDPEGLLARDDRRAWWQKWGELTGEGLDDAPAALETDPRLRELSDQPLLNHLLALARRASPADFGSDLNAVFARLLDQVLERPWGDGRQLPAFATLYTDELARLFELVGMAWWQRGRDGVVEAADLQAAGADADLSQSLQTFVSGLDPAAPALLLGFFMRRGPGGNGFELTQPSFADYLAARGLARLVDRLQATPVAPALIGERLARWSRATSGARITHGIVDFLEGELGSGEIVARRATLIELFRANLATGTAHLLAQDASRPCFRVEQRLDASAELALLATIGACTGALVAAVGPKPDEAAVAHIRWDPGWTPAAGQTAQAAWDLLRRLEHGDVQDGLARRLLLGLALERQELHCELTGADLRLVAAAGASFRHAVLRNARLDGADLSDAILEDASLDHARLTRADLRGAYLSGTRLRHADLRRARLDGIRSAGADLRGARLGGAWLRQAELVDADLTDASLRGARLVAADLSRSRLRGADLSWADLHGADLSHARLRDADLSRADLSDADLRGADLEDASLVGSRLAGADLRGARGLAPAQLGAAVTDATTLLPDAAVAA